MIRDHAVKTQTPADPAERTLNRDPSRWLPLLSVDEERELAERIKAGDQTARKQLILANLRLVPCIVRRYRYNCSKLPLDDLVQEGNLGLIRASEDFDPSVHGCRFFTYAEIWIKAFVHRALIANDSLIRIPQHVFLLRKQYRRVMGAVGSPMIAGDGDAEAEPPRVEEVAREIGVSPRRLKPARLAASCRDTRPSFDGEDEVVPLPETIVDHHLPDQDVAEQEQRLLVEAALRRLNPFEAWIIRERYGLDLLIPDEFSWSTPDSHAAREDDPELQTNPPGNRRAYFHRTYAELERDCGLSHHRIRQVEQLALQKLRDVLGPYLLRAV